MEVFYLFLGSGESGRGGGGDMKINIIGLSIRWRPSPKFKFAPNLFGLFNAYIRKLGIVGPFGPKITGGLPMPQQALPGFL